MMENRVRPTTSPSANSAYGWTPLMAYWEVTQACDLACVHCRAEAVSEPNPFELSTEEGFRLLDAVASFGSPKPHLVLTGGDPLKRRDIYALVEHAVQAGLTTSITPSGTPLLTPEALKQLQASGVRTVALSLDGSNEGRHDRIRQVSGSFERTMAAARWARDLGLSVQINTLVCAQTVDDLSEVYRRVLELDADRWSVFFLVNVGRGTTLRPIDAFICELVLEWLYDLTTESSRPIIKTTEALHFRRVALQRQTAASKQQRAWDALSADAAGQPASSSSQGPSAAQASIRQGFGIRDGAGIMFVSHVGEIYPAGFLPLSVGNVRRDDLIRLYREAPLFQQLRDPSQLKGKCGLCEYRVVCGGARSRAWAATGDPLEADPLCIYEPPGNAPHAALATATTP